VAPRLENITAKVTSVMARRLESARKQAFGWGIFGLAGLFGCDVRLLADHAMRMFAT